MTPENNFADIIDGAHDAPLSGSPEHEFVLMAQFQTATPFAPLNTLQLARLGKLAQPKNPADIRITAMHAAGRCGQMHPENHKPALDLFRTLAQDRDPRVAAAARNEAQAFLKALPFEEIEAVADPETVEFYKKEQARLAATP